MSVDHLLAVIGLAVGAWSSLLTLLTVVVDGFSLSRAMRRALTSLASMLLDLHLSRD